MIGKWRHPTLRLGERIGLDLYPYRLPLVIALVKDYKYRMGSSRGIKAIIDFTKWAHYAWKVQTACHHSPDTIRLYL